MTLKKSTMLDAVNILLSTIDQSPTSTLEGEVGVDVTRALATINEVLIQVQLSGWYFNTEENYMLTPDVSTKEIVLGDNILNVRLLSSVPQIVQRGNRLYNKDDSTYQFKSPLKATVIIGLSWDELPQYVRHYITVKAARKFQNRQDGSDTGARFTERDEAEAFAEFKNAEMEQGGYNLLDPEWR